MISSRPAVALARVRTGQDTGGPARLDAAGPAVGALRFTLTSLSALRLGTRTGLPLDFEDALGRADDRGRIRLKPPRHLRR